MKEKLLSIYRTIVGPKEMCYEEGDVKWYYFLALVVNLLITWWAMPSLGILFTICTAVHYGLMCAISYKKDSKKLAVGFFLAGALIFLICWAVCWYWTALTIAIPCLFLLFAPDSDGDYFLIDLVELVSVNFKNTKVAKKYVEFVGDESSAYVILNHAVFYLIFFIIALCMPTHFLVRLAIIVLVTVLRPVVAKNGPEILETYEAAAEALNKEDDEATDSDDDDDYEEVEDEEDADDVSEDEVEDEADEPKTEAEDIADEAEAEEEQTDDSEAGEDAKEEQKDNSEAEDKAN